MLVLFYPNTPVGIPIENIKKHLSVQLEKIYSMNFGFTNKIIEEEQKCVKFNFFIGDMHYYGEIYIRTKDIVVQAVIPDGFYASALLKQVTEDTFKKIEVPLNGAVT